MKPEDRATTQPPRDKEEIKAAIAVAAASATTPEALRDALLTLDTTDTLEVADFVNALCKRKGINTAAPCLAEYIRQCKEWKEQEARRESLAEHRKGVNDLVEKAAHYQGELSKGVSPGHKDMRELARDIAKTAATLTATGAGRERFTTYSDFLNQLRKYDPEKDFSMSLFAGLRCPNGTISIIGARPGGGKTSAMINATRETLTNTDRAAFFVNLEMNSRQILTNLCLSIMYADATVEQRTELETIEETINQFNKSFKWTGKGRYPKHPLFAELQSKTLQKIETALNEKRLYIYDGIGNTLEGITADIAKHAKEGDVVLLDYMQRTPPPYRQENQTRQVQVQLASRALLNTAIETQCVIIAGAQFNREGDKAGQEATLANFRESGDIEQDAHNAIAIEQEKDTGTCYIHVLKEREGGSRYQRMEIELVKQYVYWTAGEEYSLQQKNVDKLQPGKKKRPIYNKEEAEAAAYDVSMWK